MDDVQIDELHDVESACPDCGSIGGIITCDDGSLMCIDCYWQGDEDELVEKEVPR